MTMAERKTAADFHPAILEIFDGYVHGKLSKREFIAQAGKFAAAGVTGAMIFDQLRPDYASAQQVKADDPAIKTERPSVASPKGHGSISGLLAMPAKAKGKIPAVLVIHENRGLNPYIEDVARRLAKAGYLAFAPDGLTSVGGYPGSDDKGRELQAKLDPKKLFEDFIASFDFLRLHGKSTGKVGAVGFCYAGGIDNQLVVLAPDIIDAGVPFYGRQPDVADVPKIKAPLLIHNAGLDARILAGAPAFEKALADNGKSFESFVYEGVNHGFHNDTTPRYDEAAAKLAWERTIAFFKQSLVS